MEKIELSDDPGKGKDVEFTQFIQYLLAPEISKNPYYIDDWNLISNLCFPCQINYNAIGYHESVVEDSNFVLRLIRSKHKFPEFKNSLNKSELKQYYNTVPQNILKELFEIYRVDFLLFNYTVPSYITFSTD